MKKVLSIILMIILISSLFILTGCSKKEENSEENASKTSNEKTSKTSNKESSESNSIANWPDLEEYGIPALEKGTISNVSDNCNKDGYELNYDITVNSISKSDVEEFIQLFDSSWVSAESDNTYILVSNKRTTKYSVDISLDEENESADISISSL